MTVSHNLGFPRIGANRELKRVIEAYWQGKIDSSNLLESGRQLRARHWQQQADSGLDLIPVGDFSWYDHVLDTSMLLAWCPNVFVKIAMPSILILISGWPVAVRRQARQLLPVK